jgi:very-short-patch-repair endonuclease
MYPQYPVLKYFLDFGNPYFKIAIELDGKDYHNPDEDRKRDIELHAAGWKVFRIPGYKMVRQFKDASDFEDWELRENYDEVMEAMYHWILETGDGVIEAINQIYFTKKPLTKIDREICSLCHRTLQNHCLI